MAVACPEVWHWEIFGVFLFSSVVPVWPCETSSHGELDLEHHGDVQDFFAKECPEYVRGSPECRHGAGL